MKKVQILTAAALMLASVVRAEVWTYDDCVAYAREHNINLRKAALNEQSGLYDLEEAKGQWEPTLDFNTSHSYSNYPWSENRKNSYNGSVGLNAGWTVWNGGKRENTIKRSQIQTEIDKLATGETLRTLETDLLQVYVNLLYAREAIIIYESAQEVSGAQADRARQLMESGRISRVDYVQLQSQYEQDRYAAVNARATYDSRRMELKKLLQLGIDADIEPADVEWTAEQVLAVLPPIGESYVMAQDNDLQLRSLGLQQQSSAIDVELARAGRRPNISLNAGVGTGITAPGISAGTQLKQSWGEQIGASLSIPILDGRKTRAATARARIQEMNAGLDIDLRNTELAQLIESWYIDTRSAQARYTAATQQLESAKLTAELTGEQFRLGLVNPVELMTAHNAYIEAQYTLLQAKYMAILGQRMINYYRTSEVRL